MSPILRPARPGDYEAIYGAPLPYSFKAMTAELDGVPIGIGGIAFIGGSTLLFSKMLPELRPFKKFIVQCARQAAGLAREAGAVAVAHAGDPRSCRLLQRLGGEHVGRTQLGEVYRWPRN